MKKNKIIIITGPSGVGKGTIIKKLIENKNLNLIFSISATTRKPRVNEKDGSEYHFVTKEKFTNWIEDKKLLEWAEYAGNYYGTPRDFIHAQTQKGKNVILDIEIQGARNILKMDDEFLSIFISPPSIRELEARIKKRGSESNESIEKRLGIARTEMEQANKEGIFDLYVVNDQIALTVKKVEEKIREYIEN